MFIVTFLLVNVFVFCFVDVLLLCMYCPHHVFVIVTRNLLCDELDSILSTVPYRWVTETYNIIWTCFPSKIQSAPWHRLLLPTLTYDIFRPMCPFIIVSLTDMFTTERYHIMKHQVVWRWTKIKTCPWPSTRWRLVWGHLLRDLHDDTHWSQDLKRTPRKSDTGSETTSRTGTFGKAPNRQLKRTPRKSDTGSETTSRTGTFGTAPNRQKIGKQMSRTPICHTIDTGGTHDQRTHKD
jgi:hypothetical protein